MLNLRVVAIALVIVFVGLFTYRAFKEDSGRKVASSDIGREQVEDRAPVKKKIVTQIIKKGSPMPNWKGNEMSLADKTMSEKSIDLSKKGTGKYKEFPVYQGRKVIQV